LNPLHTYTTSGMYQVCLTVQNQFGSHTYCNTLYAGVSSEDILISETQVQIKPNPFTYQLSLSLSRDIPEAIFILYDLLGNEMLSSKLKSDLNEIDTESLPAGIYLYEVLTKEVRLKSGKVVKLRG
jgi:PKD repeat protein